MKQENKQKESTKTEEEESVEEAPQGAETEVDEDELDSLLDEIDDVLEADAQTVVSQYIQKGGQ